MYIVHVESILESWIAWSSPHYKSKTNHDCTSINHRRYINTVSIKKKKSEMPFIIILLIEIDIF